MSVFHSLKRGSCFWFVLTTQCLRRFVVFGSRQELRSGTPTRRKEAQDEDETKKLSLFRSLPSFSWRFQARRFPTCGLRRTSSRDYPTHTASQDMAESDIDDRDAPGML